MRRSLSSSLLLIAVLPACSAANPASSVPSDDAPSVDADANAGADTSLVLARKRRRTCEATSPRTTPVTVHVLPDDGEAPYLDVIASATERVRVFGYQMGFGGVLDALRAKARDGVEVRVILDGETQRDVNEKYRVLLEGDGAHVAWSDPSFTYMHAKVIVADGDRALVSTGNYSRSYMLKQRNFAATLVEPQDVADLASLFDADWDRSAPSLSCTRLLVAPVNARPRLAALIASARHDVLVESMELTDYAVRDALVERAQAGVSVRVVLAAPSWIGANQKAGAYLTGHGIAARSLASPAVHVKAMVVDGERAYLGSENLSSTSLDHNREIGIVLSDAPGVARMAETFERDFAAATPM